MTKRVSTGGVMSLDPIDGLVQVILGAAAVAGSIVFWLWMIKAIEQV